MLDNVRLTNKICKLTEVGKKKPAREVENIIHESPQAAQALVTRERVIINYYRNDDL